MKKTDCYFYPAVFTYAPDQEIAVTFPDLDVATSGTDDTDAFLSARELLGCVLFGLEQDGEEIPAPTPLKDVSLEPGERAALVDVYMPAIRMAEAYCAEITETLYLSASSETKNQIVEGLHTPLKNCIPEREILDRDEPNTDRRR